MEKYKNIETIDLLKEKYKIAMAIRNYDKAKKFFLEIRELEAENE